MKRKDKTMYEKYNKLKLAGIFIALLLSIIILKPDSVRAAEKLELNKNYTIELEDYSDSRLYEFTIPDDGNISVKAKNADPAGEREARIQLYDSDNLPLTESQSGTNVKLPIYSTEGNRTFYVKFDSKSPYSGHTSYILSIGFQPTTDWETEGNNSSEEADMITPGHSWYGTIVGDNDEYDYFKFKLKSDKKVAITFGPKKISGESHEWVVELIDSKNQSVRIYYGSTTETYGCCLKKGAYCLRVRVSGSDAKDIPYALSYTETALKLEKPVIKSFSVVGHTGIFCNEVDLNKIKVKNTGDAEGYVVKISNKKNMGKPSTTEDIHFDETNTKGQISLKTHFAVAKSYYIQAKSYVEDPFGVKIYGKYGSVKGKILKKSVYNKLK